MSASLSRSYLLRTSASTQITCSLDSCRPFCNQNAKKKEMLDGKTRQRRQEPVHLAAMVDSWKLIVIAAMRRIISHSHSDERQLTADPRHRATALRQGG
jgi:hypothetical protein